VGGNDHEPILQLREPPGCRTVVVFCIGCALSAYTLYKGLGIWGLALVIIPTWVVADKASVADGLKAMDKGRNLIKLWKGQGTESLPGTSEEEDK
jgi:hypothetical protein